MNIDEKTNEVRDDLFKSLGNVDPYVITPIINPSFMGEPQWPSFRQAFSIIRTNESIMVASTGLSDPFEDIDEENNGFRVEVIAETKHAIGDDVAASWLFKLVYSMAQQVAYSGQIADFVLNHGVITMELFASDLGLEEFANEDGMIGVMLGVECPKLPKHIAFPAEDVLLVTVQLLTSDELEYVIEEGAEGRKSLHQLLSKAGVFHYIDLSRSSLLVTKNKVPKWQFWRNSE